MEYSSSSISNTISKGSVYEEVSMFRASMEDAASRLAEGLLPRALSNEEIRRGDVVLDTYQVTSDAIHGGMGSVWCVHHKGWDVDLAMKRPQPRFFAEGSARKKEEFVAECENWINLGLHPNIVSCYYVRDLGGVPSIFSEWMDNGSLRDRMKDGSLYEGSAQEVQERILDIAIQTVRGLGYSHEHGLIHQDVKPGNILLTKGWDAKVADFGLAKAQSQLRDGNVPLSSGYTPEYCPKAQAEGAPAEPWMDVYAWALTVLEMFLHERPWAAGAEGMKYVPKKLPGGLEALLRDCLSGARKSFDGIETELTAALDGVYSRPAPDAAPDTAGSQNNRALSFLDLGNFEAAESIWKNGKLSEDPYTLFNRTIFRYSRARMGLEDCLAALKKLFGENPGMTEMGTIIEDLEKRTAVPAPARYSPGYDLKKMDKICLHPDGRLAVLHDMFDLFLIDLQDGHLIRKLEDPRWEYAIAKQLQIDRESRNILYSHYGTEGGEALQLYHVREEDMLPAEGNAPYVRTELFKFAAFAGDRLIAFESFHKNGGMMLRAFDCTELLNGGDAYNCTREEPLYTVHVQNESRFHFSPDGNRFMIYSIDEEDTDNKQFSIYDTLTGACLNQYLLPSALVDYNEYDSFAVDDEDRHMLHFAHHSKLVWYDLTHNGRNSFVWDLKGLPEMPGYSACFLVSTFPDGSKHVLIHDKNSSDCVSFPVPEDDLPVKYLLSRAYSLKEIRNLEKQSEEAMEELQHLLEEEDYAAALEKWNASQALPLFTETSGYQNALLAIDRTCRKKSLQASVRLGEFEAEPGEHPVLTWVCEGSEELTLTAESAIVGAGILRIRRADGSVLGAVRYSELPLKKKGFSLFKSSVPCVRKISRAAASPDGDMIAVHMITGYELDIDTDIPALLFLRVSSNGVKQLAFLEQVKNLNDEHSYFALLRGNFLFTDRKNNLFCMPLSEPGQIRKVSSGFPADTARSIAAAQKRMSEGVLSQEFNCSCLSGDFRRGCSLENGRIIRYALSYEYEYRKEWKWDAGAEAILRGTKAVFQKGDDKDIEDFRDVLHSLDYGFVTRGEARQRLKGGNR